MVTLAIEQSSSLGSVALFRGRRLVAERSWQDAARARPDFLRIIASLVKEASAALSDVDVFAVGLGPGSYSGLRTSLAAAQALALPGAKTVFGVSSGEALAMRLCGETDAAVIATVGNARRCRIWLAEFTRESGSRLTLKTPYALLDLSHLADALTPGAVVVTPDWDDIGDGLGEHLPAGATLVPRRISPTAQAVGELAMERIERGIPSDALTPIYLHPPVLVTPPCAPRDHPTSGNNSIREIRP
jgi:tRNA threonylcarbamoyladenosine biosynthesis protein TsaB